MKAQKGIGVRLYALIIFMIVFIVSMGSFVKIEFEAMHQRTNEQLLHVNEYSVLIDDVRQIQVEFKIQVQEWKNILIRSHKKEDFEKYYGEFENQQQQIQEQVKLLEEKILESEMDVAYTFAETFLAEHEKLYKKYQEALVDYNVEDETSYRLVDQRVRGIDRKANEDLDILVAKIQEEVNLRIQEMWAATEREKEGFYQRAIIISVISLCLMGILVYMIIETYNGIRRYIDQMSSMIEEAKEGNLIIEGKVHKEDELGSITSKFNGFIADMRILVMKMTTVGQVVTQTTEEIEIATQDINNNSIRVVSTLNTVAQGAIEQSVQGKESSLAVQGMVEGIKYIKDNTQAIHTLTYEARQAVGEGTKCMNEQSVRMDATKEASEEVKTTIHILDTKAKEIDQVVKFINEITDQINLLALNASIEAARAGEAGRGFTVVANEVRNLADLSSQSTTKISNLIDEVQGSVNKAVKDMEHTYKSIDQQAVSMEVIKENFKVIDEAIGVVGNKVKEVTRETERISTNAVAVGKNISDIAKGIEEHATKTQEVVVLTEEQAASIQEIAEAMSNLAQNTHSLQELLQVFKIEK